MQILCCMISVYLPSLEMTKLLSIFCTILHSHHQYVKDLVVSYPGPHLVISGWLNFSQYDRHVVAFICIPLMAIDIYIFSCLFAFVLYILFDEMYVPVCLYPFYNVHIHFVIALLFFFFLWEFFCFLLLSLKNILIYSRDKSFVGYACKYFFSFYDLSFLLLNRVFCRAKVFNFD